MQAVGRLESARQDAAFGQEQVSDSYSNRPQLAPVRLTGRDLLPFRDARAIAFEIQIQRAGRFDDLDEISRLARVALGYLRSCGGLLCRGGGSVGVILLALGRTLGVGY